MHEIVTIGNILKQSVCELQSIAKNPQQEAILIISHVLQVEPSYLYSHLDYALKIAEFALFSATLKRRLCGEPLAYILGEWQFWSLNFTVNPKVLIPRPETELLVELAVKLLDKDKPLKIADLGTGSGAIALALASECPNWAVFASDQSVDAVKVAQANAERLGVKNAVFYEGNWCEALPNLKFDAIISNPPYVALNDPALEETVKIHEPNLALFAGEDGLDALRIIIAEAPSKLVAGGWLMLEHGYNQRDAVRDLFQQQGFTDIVCYKDLAGHDRATVGKKALLLLDVYEIEKHLNPNFTGKIVVFDSLPSTNDYLKDQVNPVNLDLYETMQVCLAEQQTAGRGRLGRSWFAPFGKNIYLSLAWFSKRKVDALSGLSIAVSIAVADALTELGLQEDLKIKWPNDLLWQNKKLVGILVETEAIGYELSRAIIGVGVNVNMVGEDAERNISQPWISMCQILGEIQDRNEVTACLLNHIVEILRDFEQHGLTTMLGKWAQYDALIGKKIELLQGKNIVAGIVCGINEQGLLKLRDATGTIKLYASGEVSIKRNLKSKIS